MSGASSSPGRSVADGTAADGDALLVARRVTKSFGGTLALSDAALTLRRGEIHALLGANGAGKSTLSKVVSGHHRASGGEVLLRGTPVDFRNAREAMDAGVSIVMQETSLAPDLSVLENVFLPELGRPGRLSFPALRGRGERILDELGVASSLSLDVEVARLSAAQRQLVEIAKALAGDAGLIIFDEPTTSLSPGEVEHLFDIMGSLRDSGRALVFVSHRLEEVFAISDRVTVLREGATVADDVPTETLDQNALIRHMVGRDLGEIYGADEPRTVDAGAAPVFSVRGLRSLPEVRDVSFEVRPGEILGLGGLVGAGRSEAVEAIFGLRERQGGEMVLAGKPVAFRRPVEAMRAGVGLVPEDRRTQNIVPDLSVRENLLLAHTGARRLPGLGYRTRRARIGELFDALDLPIHRVDDPSMLDFSGGQQQKIIIARWLLLEPRLLILDEPTKGVDIGTRQAIYRILRDIGATGVAIVVVSSDFEELLGVSDRVVVVSDGTSIADLPSAALDEEKLTLLAAPRTSMARTTALLERLAREHDGAAFWILPDDERLVCLNAVVANPAAEPGFAAGEAARVADTRVPTALGAGTGAPADRFVAEPDGRRATLVVPVTNRRGHDMGRIGVVVPGTGDAARAARIADAVRGLHAPDREAA